MKAKTRSVERLRVVSLPDRATMAATAAQDVAGEMRARLGARVEVGDSLAIIFPHRTHDRLQTKQITVGESGNARQPRKKEEKRGILGLGSGTDPLAAFQKMTYRIRLDIAGNEKSLGNPAPGTSTLSYHGSPVL